MDTTIGEVIQTLKESAGHMEAGVDILHYGESNATVTGIATAFVASQSVIERARTLGVNLLITHEGLFYSHFGNKERIEEDPVVQEKVRVIEESGIAIYRCHDLIHRSKLDGIMAGLLQQLDWNGLVQEHLPYATILDVPEMSVQEVANVVKKKLNISHVRVVGHIGMPCKRIGLLVGYRGGGEMVIPLFERDNLDLIIYGEGPEWETPEYVRDAVFQNRQKALIVVGHAESEWAGMKYLASWIQDKYPNIPVQFIPDEPIFQII
ncbi:Nif3-like dinuclear metal center hexameric protein [Paenibacillus sp. FA6]|uniref:Nif3-like dinuclear metal center hexameric protein n=1 Tax=Paenibacillus sp. FA6 TaxID=3413029 RepID=UPI003F65F21C